jgi:hypothetical protein
MEATQTANTNNIPFTEIVKRSTMRINKVYLCSASLVACGSMSLASRAAEATVFQDSPASLYQPFTLGLEAGTTGLGGSVAWRFADHWGVRSGFDYFQYSDGGLAIKDLRYDAKIRLMSEPLTLDIYPWTQNSFHISVGMQFNQNRLTGSAVDSGTIIPPERLGSLNLDVHQQLVNPYLSIGGNFFYFDSGHHWALGGELGVAYTGDPQVNLTRSGPSSRVLDAAVHYEEGRIHDYAEKFMWWPVVKLMVTYSF